MEKQGDRQEYLDRVKAAARDLIDAARSAQSAPTRLTIVDITTVPSVAVERRMRASPERNLTREFMLRRARWLRDAYCLQWQIDQATLGGSMHDLDDLELRALLIDMECARECLTEGFDNVGFDEAGLVRRAE